MKKFTFLLLFGLLLTSCGETIEQQTLANLYLRYDADVKKLKAEATFSTLAADGTQKPKLFPNGVQFINGGMRTLEQPDGEIRYTADFSGSIPLEIDFHWDLSKEKPTVVAVPLAKIKGYTIKENTLSLKDGFSISLTTSSLKKGDKLVLAITDSNGQAKNLETRGPTNTASFQIPGTELKGLSTGPASIYVVRSEVMEKNEEHFKAIMNTEYYSLSKSIEIIE